MLSELDDKILGILGKEDVTAFTVSERLGIAWSTAKSRLMELMVEGLVDRESFTDPNNGVSRTVWRLRKDG